MYYLDWFWWLLGYPVYLLDSALGLGLPPAVYLIGKILVFLLLLGILYGMWGNLRTRLRRFRRRDSLLDDDELITPTADGGAPLKTGHALDVQIDRLKKAREYGALGDLLLSVDRFKEAAKWLSKAGRKTEAAQAWAKAGKFATAARLMNRQGEYELAARYYSEGGKHKQAARALEKQGLKAFAAAAYAKAGQIEKALEIFSEYFAATRDAVETQFEAAQACLEMIESEPAKAKVSAEQRKQLLAPLAQRFEQGKRHDLAARLYHEAGELARAGETYVLAGKFQEAAQCMRQAGKEKEAQQCMGRFYESKQQWKEAGQAYAAAGEWLRAGECFAKAADALKAGECFEKANQFYRAGHAYTHAARFDDAIRVFQRLTEKDPQFDLSRGMLGRCFYEKHDYAHCAATLDNHLTGKRVESSNVDYFYMLALAYEQLGKLNDSREILYKIRTVNVGFRDVTQRLSNISSRISMGMERQHTSADDDPTQLNRAPEATQVMESVENSLGGRYQLERELGRGGMGVVYLAQDTQLERPVALKFLGSLVDNSEEFRQRFIREARTAAKISHPNIISIYDISASVGKAYIAMEFVEGPSLHKHLRERSRLGARETLSLMTQTCAALASIHEAGIVHRDIKPDNILIAKGGLVKLTDFGLAKAEDSRMTRTGVVMGTPSYMAPEQVLGKEADMRSDIYSLGLVIHECLTGETVFAKGDVLERQLQEVPLPPGTSVADVPEELDQLIMKCIEKDPNKRFQTARELHGALRAIKTG